MAVNPTSFRFPFAISGKADPEVERAIRWCFNGLTNHEQAFAALKSQGGVSTSSSASSSSSSSSGGGSENVIIGGGGTAGVSSFNNLTGAVTYFPYLGFVNDQTGTTAYSTTQADAGTYIILDDASPIAVTLNNSGLQVPWAASFLNYGMGTATLTPASGTISYQGNIGASSMPVPQGCVAIVAFDGTNYWAELVQIGGIGVTQIIAGAGISLSPVGGTGAVTVTNTGSGSYSLGGAVTSANVALGPGAGTGATIITAGGLDGNHYVQIQTGTTPSATSVIYTLTFTASRGHNVIPILDARLTDYSSIGQVPYSTAVGISPTQYSITSAAVALAAGTPYLYVVSCP